MLINNIHTKQVNTSPCASPAPFHVPLYAKLLKDAKQRNVITLKEDIHDKSNQEFTGLKKYKNNITVQNKKVTLLLLHICMVAWVYCICVETVFSTRADLEGRATNRKQVQMSVRIIPSKSKS